MAADLQDAKVVNAYRAFARKFGKRQFIPLVFIFPLLLFAGCGYEGDGQYKSSGFWPFVSYELDLPAIKFASGNDEEFHLAKYKSHGRSLFELTISAPRPVEFHRLDTVVEVRVHDELGTTYFYRKGAINQHYTRMASDRQSSYALETEWRCDYRYDDPIIDDRVVPFDPDRQPSPQQSIRCWHFMPSGDDTNLRMSVRIGDVPSDLTNAKISLKLLSGWK